MRVLFIRPPGRPEVVAFVADHYRARLLGLAWLRELPPGTGLLIPRCRSVHTFGMRFWLDVMFVTLEHGSLLAHDARHGVSPGRLVRASPSARAKPGLAALELPA
jgi:uncharacterized membrane protein (UPF0127 family)